MAIENSKIANNKLIELNDYHDDKKELEKNRPQRNEMLLKKATRARKKSRTSLVNGIAIYATRW